MNLIVRIPSAELEGLGTWAARFHLVPEDGGSVTEVYEAKLERAELEALCEETQYTCDVGDDGMGEIRDGERVVARVRTWGRVV